MRRSLSVLPKILATTLLVLTLSSSAVMAQVSVTVDEITRAFEEAGLGLAAKAKADADVLLAQTAYDSAVDEMSTPAVRIAVADIERLAVALEALAVAKANGVNVANAITAAETELTAAKAVVDSKKPAYDAAAANLAAATATAARVKASYDNALALIATAIEEPNAAIMAELDVANARIAHLSLSLQKVVAAQALADADQQEQLDDQGAAIEEMQAQLDWQSDTVASLVDKSDKVSRLQVGLETNNQNDAALAAQVDDLQAYVAADAVLKGVLCGRLRKDLYGKPCAVEKAAAAVVAGTVSVP